jgi:hypothetical protein
MPASHTRGASRRLSRPAFHARQLRRASQARASFREKAFSDSVWTRASQRRAVLSHDCSAVGRKMTLRWVSRLTNIGMSADCCDCILTRCARKLKTAAGNVGERDG